MKKFTKLVNESIESMTWSELIDHGQIDFVGCSIESIRQFLPTKSVKPNDRISDCEETQLTNNITIYDAYDFILVCKNNDPLAIVSIYEIQGFDNFKNIVVLYGHEQFAFFDCDDFTHKIIDI